MDLKEKIEDIIFDCPQGVKTEMLLIKVHEIHELESFSYSEFKKILLSLRRDGKIYKGENERLYYLCKPKKNI